MLAEDAFAFSLTLQNKWQWSAILLCRGGGCSAIFFFCLQNEMPGGAEQQTMRVYLRVRPFSKEELSDNEDQVQYEGSVL